MKSFYMEMNNLYTTLKNISTNQEALEFVKMILSERGWVIARTDVIASRLGAYRKGNSSVQILCDIEFLSSGELVTSSNSHGMTIMRDPGLYIRVGNIANSTREFRLNLFDEYMSELRDFLSFINS